MGALSNPTVAGDKAEKENAKSEAAPAKKEEPKGLFGAPPTFSFSQPPTGGLFGAKTDAKPLFGGLETVKPTEEKPANGNLFGSGAALWKPAVGGEFGGQKVESKQEP